jgi:hypothetical protein
MIVLTVLCDESVLQYMHTGLVAAAALEVVAEVDR